MAGRPAPSRGRLPPRAPPPPLTPAHVEALEAAAPHALPHALVGARATYTPGPGESGNPGRWPAARTTRIERKGRAMTLDEVEAQIVETWRINNAILLQLLEHIPRAGMTAVPAGSRGRDVRAQFAHLDRVRRGWLEYFRTGQRPRVPRYDKARPPDRARLRKALAESGRAVEQFLRAGVRGETRPRMFGRQVVRWMGYLIAHDSHHRGQIMLALKQTGLRLPEEVALQGVWGSWHVGRSGG